jgi:putative ABC transport system permease protein
MKQDPISSIRQNGDYQIPKKLRRGRIAGQFLGVPGLMSAKYYSVSRKKYRSTVISLTLSVIIFLTSVGFTGIFTELAGENSNTSNYDFRISTTPERYEEIRNLDFVEKSAMVWHESYEGILTSGTYTAEHLEIMEKLAATGLYVSPGLSPNLYFLEDAHFRTYLQEQGIDPEPYFQGDIPRAVCLRSKGTIYIDHEDGTFNRVTMTAPVFETVPAVIDVYSSQLSSRLIELIFSFGGGMSFEYTDWEGHLIQTFDISDGQVPEEYPVNSDGTISFIRIPRTTEDGNIVEDFHYFSLDTLTVGEYLLTEEDMPVLPDIEVLDQVDELPFGVDGYSHCNSLVLILPESWLFENCIDSLKVKTSDYHAMIAWLRSNLEEYEYQNLLESQIQYRNMMTMIHVFSYGFIILVSLICVCNVFNTISTNIALRRRDFGMLRSVGMQERQLRRMLGLECARYGVRSLLWGLPIGVGAGYGIYRLLDLGSGFPYRFPWLPISAAVAAVFVIVFITMFYAVSKLRKDNPIEAIRVSTL